MFGGRKSGRWVRAARRGGAAPSGCHRAGHHHAAARRHRSRSATVAKMDLSVLRRWVPSRRMATACTTWPATSGNGVAIGTGSMLTLRPQVKTFVATLPDRLKAMIQCRSGSEPALRWEPRSVSKVSAAPQGQPPSFGTRVLGGHGRLGFVGVFWCLELK